MTRISKISAYIVKVISVLLVALPAWICIQWLCIDTQIVRSLLQGPLLQTVHTPEGYISLGVVDWNSLTKAIGLLSYLIGFLPVFLSLFALHKIFSNYAMGNIFTVTNARLYTRLGWLLVVDALLFKSISHMLLVVAVTLSNPPGHRYISIAVGTPNIEALVAGAFVLMIAWVMREASAMAEEQRLTV